MKKIKARWVVKKGHWSNATDTFIHRVKEETTRELSMEVRNDILYFRGGPTGYESYYIDDIKNLKPGVELCICAGTINRWAECYVQSDDVLAFLEEVL